MIYVLSICDFKNYGNRLQNFALLSILSQYNQSISNLYFNPNNQILSAKLYQLYIRLRSLNEGKSRYSFLSKFIKFSSRYTPFAFEINRNFTFKKSENNIVIIGSDQVWNYRWLSNENLALRLGSFVPDNVPIISYAASFGVSEVDDDVKPIFKKYLPRLKAISVREDRGAELVKEMTGLDATVLLDPTLMLTAEQWNTITSRFVPDDDRYVLTYFLGKPSDEQEKTIQSYAKTHGCRVRRILDLRDKETYVAGPQDFVELFSKAQYVFTDSYHACCFSILYHKQFTVFNRAGMEGKANMNSRMETLFRLFDLDSVVMDKGLAPRIDYDKVDQLLARHRAESQAWLDKAMEA